MGCIISTLKSQTPGERHTGAEQRPTSPALATNYDRDIRGSTSPPMLGSCKPSESWAPHKISSILTTIPSPLPGYETLQWPHRILSAIGEFQKVLSELGLEMASLLRTDVTVFIDDNHRFTEKQATAISILMGVFIPFLNSIKVEASFFFMTHQNPERVSYDNHELAAAVFLDSLYEMDSAGQIKSQLDSNDVPSLIKKTTLKRDVDAIWGDDTIKANERLAHIVCLIRDHRYNFAEPFKFSNYNAETFQHLFTNARTSDSRQPKVLSNLTFYITRAVQQQANAWNRRRQDTSGQTTRKKIFIITAEDIDKTPFKRIADELDRVGGGGSENSIQHIEFVDHERKRSRGQKLDDMKAGDRDIYDFTSIDIDHYLRFFLSGPAFVKLFFSEEQRVDGLKFQGKRSFYGQYTCERAPDGIILLPAREHYQQVLQGYSSDARSSEIIQAT